ncbi:MAG TPA: 5-oxoprolinase subunit PxpB [Terriglobales bacterium]
MRMIPASDSSLLVVVGNAISSDLQARVLTLFHTLQARRDSRIRNLHPAYASLLIDFDPLVMTHEEVATLVETVLGNGPSVATDNSEVVEIPVCYDEEFGPDLADVAEHNHISVAEVVELHSSATYYVCFLGFTAGFAYLGGLPDGLHTPRLSTPRRLVAGGSVGIAGSQTGIYPTETPGGWRLIGRTPLRMFDPQAESPTRLQPGDRVHFAAIDRATFERIQRERE